VGGGAAAPPGTLRTLGGYLRNIVINKLPPAFRIDTHPMRSVPLRRTRPPDPPGRRGCRARSARLGRRTRGGGRGVRVIDHGKGRPVPYRRRCAAGPKARQVLAFPLAAAVLAGCSAPAATEAGGAAPVPEQAGFDYQIGGAYPPPPGVGLVIRDRAAEPADGAYSVCYVNGFQTQEAATARWRADHPELLLTEDGEPVMDTDRNEQLFDVSTGANRTALAETVGAWIEGCAADGFDAVEIDNLDSPLRSRGLLTEDDALAYAGLLIERAHAAGLAAGQKNAVESAGRGA